MQIVAILKSLNDKLIKLQISDKKKRVYVKEIENLIDRYAKLDIDTKNEVYQSLVRKGKEVQKNLNALEIENYLRYCQAALYDFEGNLKPLSHIFRAFLLTSILFMILAPQFLGPILPLVFILPIFLGIKGLKKRSSTGLTLALSVLPIGLLTSVIWIKNSILAFNEGNVFFEELAKVYKLSLSATKGIFTTFVILSILLGFASIYTFIMGVRHKKMFV
ncbi:hypothetical protein [Thermobrachium celere]|uniref:Alpha-glucosidase n=1 Tax=Thermobrachium celere DSM 8682 TaxID=941824 RepID=R7RUD3_9CLOT|nr:hypothetical protein [Thermobrachium celere]CDF59061.1 hypothetical protein TCEL_02129 [Thermobrachium celere DSM 8682]